MKVFRHDFVLQRTHPTLCSNKTLLTKNSTMYTITFVWTSPSKSRPHLLHPFDGLVHHFNVFLWWSNKPIFNSNKLQIRRKPQDNRPLPSTDAKVQSRDWSEWPSSEGSFESGRWWNDGMGEDNYIVYVTLNERNLGLKMFIERLHDNQKLRLWWVAGLEGRKLHEGVDTPVVLDP